VKAGSFASSAPYRSKFDIPTLRLRAQNVTSCLPIPTHENDYCHLASWPEKIRLSDIDPDETGGIRKEDALQQFAKLREE
jgi:hypothetical protein